MNLWKEPYPGDLGALIAKCDHLLPLLEKHLAQVDCPKVKDLYANKGTAWHLIESEWCRAVCDTGIDQGAITAAKGEERKGLYVFRDAESGAASPLYLGISRNVKKRLRQHAWGGKHNTATLAYLMAKTKEKPAWKRRDEIPSYLLKDRQEYIENLQVAILLEPNDYDLYFMEVYFAGKWKTPWNSFRTH